MIDGQELPTIEAGRINLRWLDEKDVPDLFNIFSHPEVMRYWSSPPMLDAEEARKLLRHVHDGFRGRSLFQWGVAEKDSDRVIGTCTLVRADRANRRSELGYALGREWWGKGLAREAVTALIGYAFQTLDLRRLEADVDPRNEPSLRMLERLGFSREGYLRQRWEVGGETQDSVILGLLRSEWVPPRGHSGELPRG